MPVTFKCHDVQPKAVPSREMIDGESHLSPEQWILSKCQAIDPELFERSFVHLLLHENLGGVEAAGMNLDSNWRVPFDSQKELINPLIYAMTLAYNLHWELVLSPDDLWLAIVHGFARHVNMNAEELRSQFVDFEDKEKLLVRRDDFIKGSPENDWLNVFAEFSTQISKFIGKKRDLVCSDFSTTGIIEKAASEIVLMDVVQSYFEYQLVSMSGFSKITLLGETSDWESIRRRVQNFNEFGLEWWTVHLLPVLGQFVAASKGCVDRDFWQRAFIHHGGSGLESVTGWVLTLFPYLRDKTQLDEAFTRNQSLDWQTAHKVQKLTDISLFGPFLSQVPFTWEIEGKEHEMELLGGLLSPAFDLDGSRVRICTCWGVRNVGALAPNAQVPVWEDTGKPGVYRLSNKNRRG